MNLDNSPAMKISIRWTSLSLTFGVAAIIFIIQVTLVARYLYYDPDMDPVEVHPSKTLKSLYLTGPTEADDSLLTLFTTMSDTSKAPKVHSVILNNWAHLSSLGVQPVLFSTFTNASLLNEAVGLGWDALPLNRTNRFNVPYIKDIFQAAYHYYKSEFYMFASGDVLFDESLVKTLRDLLKYKSERGFNLNDLLAVGMRSNIPVDVVNPPPFWDLKFVDLLVKREKPIDVHAVDYFITRRFGYLWHQVPNLVLGRLGVAPHLLETASRSQLMTVDATDVIHAVHLKAVIPLEMVKPQILKDSLYNHFILGGWDSDAGRIDKTVYVAQYKNNTLVLENRKIKMTAMRPGVP